MSDEKTIIDWRKEALAAGVENVSKLDKAQCKKAIAKAGKAPVKEAPVKEAPVKEAPVKEALVKEVLVKEESLEVQEARLLRELNTIEDRKVAIGKELQKINLERRESAREYTYIEQLEMARAQDRKSKADKTKELADQIKKFTSKYNNGNTINYISQNLGYMGIQEGGLEITDCIFGLSQVISPLMLMGL